MNWLNSNMHSDDSDLSQSDSESQTFEPLGTNTANSSAQTPSKTKTNKCYHCLICDKRTASPILNKQQCCLQCPHCRRSWCLEDRTKIRKPANLDLINKRYLEIKFSARQHRRHDHHSTKHTLSWIGTNILGNLGDINDTLHELQLAQNVQDLDLESLRAQRRFGIHHPNADSYHATHPAIIEYLPVLDVNTNETHKALLEHSVCPICQLHFVDGTDSSDDELDALLAADEHENVKQKCKTIKQEEEKEEDEEDMFALMHQSRNANQVQASNQHGDHQQPMDMIEAHHAKLNEQRAQQQTVENGVVSVYAANNATVQHHCKESVDIGGSLIAQQSHAVKQDKVSRQKPTGPVSVVAAWKPTMKDDGKKGNDANLNDLEVKQEEQQEHVLGATEEVKEEEECGSKGMPKIMDIGDCVVRLWCGHVFHRECVIAWLSKQNTCPLCRFQLPSNNPTYELQRRVETYDSEVYHVMT